METPKDILAAARAAWFASRSASRDSQLTVGRLLRRYILARIAETDGMNEADRVASGNSREDAISAISLALSVTRSRVNQLIHLSAVVDLLSDGGNVGELSYSAIRAMRSLVRRRRGKIVRSRKRKDRPFLPSSREEWVIAGGADAADDAIRIFRRAVDEGLSVAEIQPMLSATSSKRPPARRCFPSDKPVSFDLHAIARTASPRDFAEMLIEAVAAAADPEAVWQAMQALNVPVEVHELEEAS